MKHFIKTLFLVLVTGAGVSQTCSVQASNVNATQHQAPATTRGPVDKNNNQHHEGPSASVGRILDLAKEPEPLPLKRLISASAIIHQSRSRSSSTVNLSERPSSNNDCGQLETRPRHRSGRSLRVVLKSKSNSPTKKWWWPLGQVASHTFALKLDSLNKQTLTKPTRDHAQLSAREAARDLLTSGFSSIEQRAGELS